MLFKTKFVKFVIAQLYYFHPSQLFFSVILLLKYSYVTVYFNLYVLLIEVPIIFPYR